MATDPAAGPLDAQRFAAFTNGSYHADREGFLDWTHRVLLLIVILLGTSALLEVMPPAWRQISAALTTLAGTLDLVFDLTTRARKHGHLRREYFELAASLAEGRITPAEADAAMLRSAADEEPPFCAAHAVAENWASMAVYGGGRVAPCRITGAQRLFRHVWRFNGSSFAR